MFAHTNTCIENAVILTCGKCYAVDVTKNIQNFAVSGFFRDPLSTSENCVQMRKELEIECSAIFL